MNVNIVSSRLTDSVYFEANLNNPVMRAGRVFQVFLFKPPHDATRAEQAALALNRYVEDNHPLKIIGPKEVKSLADRLIRDPYVVVNEDVVVLSDRPLAPGTLNVGCTDIFFSGAVLWNPVVCSNGKHVFEYEQIKRWVLQVGDVCPGGDHKVYTEGLNVSSYKQEQVRQKVAHHDKTEKLFRDVTVAKLELVIKESKEAQSNNPILVGEGVQLVATGSIILLEKSLRRFAKWLPAVSIIMGAGCAALRIRRGFTTGDKREYVKAAGDLLAAFASTTLTPVMLAALLIEGANIIHDYKVRKELCNTPKIDVDEKAAREILGLSLTDTLTPEQINTAHRDLSKVVHPDLVATFRQCEIEMNELQALVNNAKDLLLKKVRF